ncbi:MAG TPA: hypothetical protein VHZ95_07730 [Polyangiales bacterium]|jgi:hypothetical protein|nr:hypothetical protein [Polyangiales bacterium]
MTEENQVRLPADPSELLRSALHEFVDAGIEALASWLQQAGERVATPTAAIDERAADAFLEAAALLGVDCSATVADIRAAFRARVKDSMAAGQFHDQAGGHTDHRARELIDAKNLLLSLAFGSATSHDVT